MALTDADRRFYEECGRLIAELDVAEAAVLSAQAALGGRVRLAVPTVFGRRHLPARIRALIDFLIERWGDEPYWEQC